MEVRRDQMLERPLPNSPESERAILGSIILDNALASQASKDIRVEWFYVPSNRLIFTAMLSLFEQGREISPVVIAEELGGMGSKDVEVVGGVSYISNLTYGLPHFSNLAEYTRIIRLKAQRRWLIKLANQVATMALDGDESEEKILEFAASQVNTARERLPQAKRRVRTLAERSEDQRQRYELFFKGVTNAVPTGFSMIDENLLGGGLVPSALYILAARPSIGKTALALDIAASVAHSGKRVYIVSREMPAESLFDRLHAAESSVARWKLRAGIYESDYRKLIETLPQMERLDISLDDGSLSVSEVRSNLREMQRKSMKPDFLVVDYLQLMEADSKARGNRNVEVGSISRSLKGLAMEFQMPVLALSQLSRECEKEKREPELRDLRDSGEVEQDGDCVFFLFGEKPEEDATYFARKLKCAKQRDGKLFRIDMPFNGELVTFRSLSQIVGQHDYSNDPRFM